MKKQQLLSFRSDGPHILTALPRGALCICGYEVHLMHSERSLSFSCRSRRKMKMPKPSPSFSNGWLLSFKAALVSAGVLSFAMFMKLSVPVVVGFVSELPSIWSVLLSWLRPPYLYLLINAMIISIVVSTKLYRKLEDPTATLMATVVAPPVVEVPGDARTGIQVREGGYMLRSYGFDVIVNLAEEEVSEEGLEVLYGEEEVKHPVLEMEEVKLEGDERVNLMINEDEADLGTSPPTSSGLPREDSMEFLFPIKREKPSVSSRFAHRKPVKASPEAKSLGVSKPKRHDTLENTWKTITEGRSMPLSRHLKKLDTWENHGRRSPPADQIAPTPMKKSETFSDRKSTTESTKSGKLRKEPSLSQDDLNRRVEAFIRKFNEEMRLQRQASLNQYQEMIAGGSY